MMMDAERFARDTIIRDGSILQATDVPMRYDTYNCGLVCEKGLPSKMARAEELIAYQVMQFDRLGWNDE